MQVLIHILYSQTTQTLTVSKKHTQFSTEEADLVVATEAMSLVLVEADKTIVLVILVDHISCLVQWYAIMGFSLDKGMMKVKNDWRMPKPKHECQIL